MRKQSPLEVELALDRSGSPGSAGEHLEPAAASSGKVSRNRADRAGGLPLRDEMEAQALRAFASNGFADAMVGRTAEHLRPSRAVLDHGPHAQGPGQLPQMAEAMLRMLVAVVRRIRARWMRRRQARDSYLGTREPDARTLRDIGFDRSLIWSFAAEVTRDTDSTRVRPLRAPHGLRF